jgi:siroheme synthase
LPITIGKALQNQTRLPPFTWAKKSARFVQGRLLMFGASPQTEISIVENASRTDMRILETNLSDLVETLRSNDVTGPALIFYGLSPRQAQSLPTPQNMEFA